MNPPYLRFFRLLSLGLLLIFTFPPAARADEVMRQVQEELRRRNLYFGDVDGRATPQIAAALRRFQQRKGFQPTGETDVITLRSLSIVTSEPAPDAPSSKEEVRPVPIVATEHDLPEKPPTPWPDMPVLHSDQGRLKPPPPQLADEVVDPTPPPVLKPPPAAMSQRWPSQDAVRSFVADYLRSGESNRSEAQIDYYADKVDYFNNGLVERKFIAKDTARYNKRWPERRFALAEPFTLAVAPENSQGEMVANFRCRFTVKSPGDKKNQAREVNGETENTYVLVRTGPDSLRIVSIKEQRVRSK